MAGEEKVFIPHLTECWAPAITTGSNAFKLLDPCDLATTDDLKVVKYDKAEWSKLKGLPMLSTLPAFEQASTVYAPVVDPLEGKDNIAELQFVSEASVVHAIRSRYKKNIIYTDVGRIVIALNPFQSRDDLYNEQNINRYARADSPYTLPPHLYQIAAGAYKGIQDDAENQSTLITGESGAGKTESTKLLLRFFATLNGHLGQSKGAQASKASIEDRIVMANPILEAFGNASTSRNPNSSRFGKWIEVFFDARMKIRGATITSYMLEMPRVCEHLHCDRGYHIFYQVVTQKLSGTSGDIKQFKYMTPTPPPPGITTKGHGKKVNDDEMYQELVEALKDFEFTANEQSGIFNLVGCILHLGNITFTAANIKGGEGSTIDGKSESDVKQAAVLLGCDDTILRSCLLLKKLTVGKETTEVPLKPQDAVAARNSLAKLIYGSLFNLLLHRINLGLTPSDDKGLHSIGILDIAGFERFDVNSFEQLLINLSNEKLQQRFNQDIIQAELEDYKKEGLVELQLDFNDNAGILQLIEGKGGIMDILDEELFVPKGTDEGFSSKVVKAHGKCPSFISSKFAGDSGFSVSHFAGIVPYTATGWLDKNRLAPPREAYEALNSAHNNVVKQMIALIVTDTKKSTVGSSFKKQLADLMSKIKATQSHYVRCVKPNSLHKPGTIESHEMLRQLKCAGIMEAIKIRKSGFSLRITFADFVERYAILVGIGKPKTKETCNEIINIAKQKGKIADKEIVMATNKVMAREHVRELLDRMRIEAVEELKRPLLPFIEAFEGAMESQGGMFLYPQTILPDCSTPEALEKKRRILAGGLEEVKKKLGTLENPPGWVGTAIMVENSMKKEIEIVTMAFAALDRVEPLSCDESVVKVLEATRSKAKESGILSSAVEKVERILNLIYEERDWESQLSSPDTDQQSLLMEIKSMNRDILTPSCHKIMAEVSARIESAKAAKKKEEADAAAIKAKRKAEEEAQKAIKEAESDKMNVQQAARQSSETITRADTVLQKIEPQMPPSKSPASTDGIVGSKASIAKTIAKKATAKASNPLAVTARPKSKAAPIRSR